MVGNTFQYNVVLELRGEGPEKQEKYGTDLGQILSTFSVRLEKINTLKYSSDDIA